MHQRMRPLNHNVAPSPSKCVVYVMSRDQRVTYNHALLAAQQDALEKKLPLIVMFNLSKSGVRAREHYQFMLQGLKELVTALDKLNIGFVITIGRAKDNILKIVSEYQPASVYFDFSPLNRPTRIRNLIAQEVKIPCYEVDTHNIIPAWVASDHQEFAAHTLRPKIHRLLPEFISAPDAVKKHPYKAVGPKPSLKEAYKFTDTIKASGINFTLHSGEQAAQIQLKNFITNKLKDYALQRNDPNADALSNLSPYLHFGQIASLQIALEVMKVAKAEPLLFKEARMAVAGDEPSEKDGMNALFEELIVRKELSDNFCFYAKSYDDFSGVPAWARSSLNDHKNDKRDFTYSLNEWEVGQTHDPAWNAAQIQLRKTGKMHGYMRMYWAKKVLEWSVSPEQALKDCIYLNDHYSIDGGDPNGYVGILWSLAGLHDRPWTERPVFGKIRYMNSGGLSRKFNLEEYIKAWTN